LYLDLAPLLVLRKALREGVTNGFPTGILPRPQLFVEHEVVGEATLHLLRHNTNNVEEL
jgi:hypothetical protein